MGDRHGEGWPGVFGRLRMLSLMLVLCCGLLPPSTCRLLRRRARRRCRTSDALRIAALRCRTNCDPWTGVEKPSLDITRRSTAASITWRRWRAPGRHRLCGLSERMSAITFIEGRYRSGSCGAVVTLLWVKAASLVAVTPIYDAMTT